MTVFPWFNSKIFQSKTLEVQESAVHGRGVFTLAPIKKGTIIEICPLILLHAEDSESLGDTRLRDFYFIVPGKKKTTVLALGYGSFYNHASFANATYLLQLQQKRMLIKAFKDIAAHTEITINYHGHPNDERPVCFSSENLAS